MQPANDATIAHLNLRIAYLRGVLGSITNMGGSAASYAKSALATDDIDRNRDPGVAVQDPASIIADLITIVTVAMPADLRAQDVRVLRAEALLAKLGGEVQ